MFSLITICMNREAHLRRAVPAWLALPGLDEVVIVDWSTRAPFDDLLSLDPRLRIVRVEDEPRWVQTYPTNLGIAHTRGELVLKCDADCLPSPAITALRPAPGRFYAGDWRAGRAAGKGSISGQCFFTKAQWAEVNGYSELFRRYAHDDIDYYRRLGEAGHVRHDLPADALDFLPHDDAARVAHQERPATPSPASSASAADLEAFLHRQLDYHEAINVVVSQLLPWGPWFPQARYETLSTSADGRLLRLRRDHAREIPLSPAVMQLARAHALRAIVARLTRLPAAQLTRLDEAAQLRLLAPHAAAAALTQHPAPVAA